MTPLEHALAYAARGWRVAPIPPGEKYPAHLPQWQKLAHTDADRLTKYWTLNPDHGVCIVTGPESGVFAIDIDPDDGGDDSLRALEARHGEFPDTVQSLTGGGGTHYLFAWPDGREIRNSASGVLGVGIDVRGIGGQIVVAPTVHPSGRAYAWEIEHDPFDGVALADAPEWLIELLTAAPASTEPRRPERKRLASDPLPGDWWESQTSWPDELARHGWTIHSQHHDAQGGYYELWTRPGKQASDGASASLYWQGSDVLKVFSTNAAPLEAERTYSLWGFHVAMVHGNDFEGAARTVRKTMPRSPVSDTSPSSSKPESDIGGGDSTANVIAPANGPFAQPYTVLGNARRLVAEHGGDLRHVPQWGAWLTWDGTRWVEDYTGEVHRRAKAVVDSFTAMLPTMTDSDDRKKLFGWWMRSQSPAVLSGTVQLAATEPGVPVLVDALDADPWVLNTRTGALDLRTATMSASSREALCTKIAPVGHDPAATCPNWLAFLDWAMQGDAELVGFLQRAVGYTLTGNVGEQVLFFLHGMGSNGKSTFLTVLQRMLGDYAFSAEADLLLAVGHERHSTGVADLHGRRMVIVQEIDEGRRLDEALVKRLTGGDAITARRMRQDNFMFEPSHKLWMAANHKPVVRGTDHAIWRRIRLVPFLATVADADKDPNLVTSLLEEAPGILNWALAGCQEWRSGGLRAPEVVSDATSGYRNEQDHVGRFLEACCTIEPSLRISTKDLRAAYDKWCFEEGEKPWSAQAMAAQLQDRGLVQIRANGGARQRMWQGVALEGDAAEELSKRLQYDDWQSRASGEQATLTDAEPF
jgi:P4 family phage/plasmid primase-like protien